MTRLARYLEKMPGRPPSAREILSALIDAGDIQAGQDGELQIVFTPDAETLDALMCFDAIDREDDEREKFDEPGPFYGSGSSDAA